MSERDDDELDDASMKSMRAVWLSMRDEEPPAAGMSALMAAAASKAEQMRPQISWWQRVVVQLRRPPALAFATVLVLIGGAVLVTRNQADKKVDALSAAENAPAGDLGVREAEQPRPANAEPVVVPPAPVEESVNAPPPADPVPEKTIVATKPDPKPGAKEKKPTPKPEGPRDHAGKNEPTRYDRFEDGDTSKTGFSQGGAKDTGPGTVMQTPPTTGRGNDAPIIAPTGAKTDEPKKPQEPTMASETVTLDSTPRRDSSRAAQHEQLAKQAETAASRGDCAAVRAIVGRLKQQDEAFYKTRLGKNAAVTKCL